VVRNDSAAGEIVLSIVDGKTHKMPTKVRYEVKLPYNQILKIARLVHQARTFATLEDEDKFRRFQSQTIIDQSYFHPSDRFVAVSNVTLFVEMALQSDQERSFVHTWSATGDSDVVPIPDIGMVDNIYVVTPIIENIPTGGDAAVFSIPSATRTPTQFVLLASGSLLAGTTIMIFLRDA